MICPYCDRVLADAQELSNCPHCGGNLPACQDPEELRRTVAKTLTFPNPPIGKYQDADGYLEIGTDSLTIFSRPYLKSYKRTIPFYDLYAVSYKDGRPFCSGFLCIREWKDRHLPLMTNSFDAVSDETSLYFRHEKNMVFRKVYDFLNQCVQIIRNAAPEVQHDKLFLLMGRYKCFYGYMELGKDAVIISKNMPLGQKIHRLIPYHSIMDVKIKEAQGNKSGELQVFERRDLSPFSSQNIAASVADNGIEFRSSYNQRMWEIYRFLKEQSEKNRQSPAHLLAQQKKAELEAAGTLFCPACLATSVQSVRVPKPYIHRPLSVRDPKLSILSNSIYLTRMAIRSAEPETFKHTCSNCGHQWTAQKK